MVPAAVISPTFVPDVANAALDLLIDEEQGIWHLANVGAVSWLELVRRGAELAGVSSERLREAPVGASAPPCAALGSERGLLLPTFDDALARYAVSLNGRPASARPGDAFEEAAEGA